ncbi:MAG: T9SS type A sorting domain-containing protein [Bacteroidota bacterium]
MKQSFTHPAPGQLSAKGLFVILLFLVFAVEVFSQVCPCGNGRYTQSIFGRVSLGANVQYTQNASPNFDGSVEHETMDIWGPAGDNCTKRPLIIWVHGGGFAQMDKTAPDVVAMCDTFARRGFVVASIDYRDDYWGPWGPVNDFSMNPTPYDNKEFTRADYRAMQDAKCAVRFFKANAAQYGIDTNFIFMGGTSAGAWTSLMVAYLDKASEKPAEAYAQSLVAGMYARPDLGSVEGNGGWSNYSSKIKGIISCWGAIPDTAFIDGPNDPAAIIFHEYGDPVVNYYYGPPFQGQYPNFNSYWGTHYIDMQMQNVGTVHKTFPINGSQHALYPYRALVTAEVSYFLDSIICSSVMTGVDEMSSGEVSIYPNPCSDLLTIALADAGQRDIILFSSLGAEVGRWAAEGDMISIAVGSLPRGIYLLVIGDGDKALSKKIILQ